MAPLMRWLSQILVVWLGSEALDQRFESLHRRGCRPSELAPDGHKLALDGELLRIHQDRCVVGVGGL